MKVIEALYVLGLNKNLISMSSIEDRGYEVVFKGKHVLMYLMIGSICSTKVNRGCHGKLYRFLYQSVGELVSSVGDGT